MPWPSMEPAATPHDAALQRSLLLSVASFCLGWAALRLSLRALGGRPSSLEDSRAPPEGYRSQPAFRGAPVCLVCSVNSRDAVCHPCRHASLCWDCAQAMMQRVGPRSSSSASVFLCPICRRPVDDCDFFFMS